MADRSGRKDWTTPDVVRYGSVQEITQTDKTWGSTDGMTLEGEPIKDNVS